MVLEIIIKYNLTRFELITNIEVSLKLISDTFLDSKNECESSSI